MKPNGLVKNRQALEHASTNVCSLKLDFASMQISKELHCRRVTG